MAEKEYIERNNVISHKRPFTEFDEGGWSCKVQAVAVEDIQNIPAADVVPVRHGHWEQGDIYDIGDVCSICQYDSLREPCKYKFCPNCGARMGSDTK